MKNCDCGATSEGKWAGVHSPDCVSVRKRTVESLEKAITDNNWAVVFLDGRNEHGSHVIPMLPTSLPREFEKQLTEDKDCYSEEILAAAEELGFKIGRDVVWTTWRWNEAQYGEYGRIELEGYWDFDKIDAEMSRLFNGANTETD